MVDTYELVIFQVLMVCRNGKNQNSFYDPDIRARRGRKSISEFG